MVAAAWPRSPLGPVRPRSPFGPRSRREPREAKSCQSEPGQGPGLSFNAMKLDPLIMVNVQAAVLGIAVIGAARSETVAGLGETNPILRTRRARRVAQRLKCT